MSEKVLIAIEPEAKKECPYTRSTKEIHNQEVGPSPLTINVEAREPKVKKNSSPYQIHEG